jgi:glycine cleavage system pyridoxal-binding protein P
MSESEQRLADMSGKFVQVVSDSTLIEDAEWTKGRVLLSNKRLILASQEGKQTIPLSAIDAPGDRYDVNQQIELVELPWNEAGGTVDADSLERYDGDEFAAVVVQQPNFFGALEEVDAITDWAHRHNALVIAVNNPMSLALLKPPGRWGEHGADIACGDGQPLGAPMSGGGPYYGFICCRQAYVR